MLATFGLLDAVNKGQVEGVDFIGLLNAGPPEVLGVNGDQEQKQLTAVAYLQGKIMHLTLEWFDDFSHRMHNGKDYAVREAGLKTLQYHSMLFLNLEHGSFNTAQNKGTFGSYPAELAIVRNLTVEEIKEANIDDPNTKVLKESELQQENSKLKDQVKE